MTSSKILFGITILTIAVAGACSDGETPGSGGAAGSSSGASDSGGDQGTGGSASSGGHIRSGGVLSSGGSMGSGGESGTGGGNTGGSSIGSGGATVATGGMTVATGGATGGGGGKKGGATATGGATGGVTGLGGAAGGEVGGRGSASGGMTGTGGKTGNTGGATANPGGSAGGGATGGATVPAGGATGSLPALHVDGQFIKDPSGKTIVLRGCALIDIGALYLQGNSATGITKRIDAIAAAGLQAHVVRMPVYPQTDFNGNVPYYSGLPYPVGTPAPAGQKVTVMTGPDYISKVLKPAVDYATTKNMYAIIDLHQIDDTNTAHNSGAAATSFWTDIAPVFKDYSNVIYELFNEPINGGMAWATFKPQVQTWIDTVRAAAPNNLIVVPSMSWDQHPGDAASSPPQGTNLVYTAHIYPNNWGAPFQKQLATAVAVAPVFITEWGYSSPQTTANWGTAFETLVDSSGASWTAWVTDNSWGPAMFSNSGLTTLTDFGTLVKTWLAAKVAQDWVQ
jgi:Cellulase (glycosyl hydrolase family 5)